MALARVGCSGWMYKDWRGIVYPKELPARRWFEHYTTLFDTVELNNTFYRLPPPATADSWGAQAPPGFLYALKLGQFGSHRMKLRDAASWLPNHLDRAQRLGPSLGPTLVQLPPRWKRNVERLDEFLSVAPTSMRWAVELRDESWVHVDTFDVLRAHGAALCIHDLLPDHPWELTTDWTYVRFHGPNALERKYFGRYGAKRLVPAAEQLSVWLDDGRDVYAYFNNDYEGHAVKDAGWLRDRLVPVDDRQVAGAAATLTPTSGLDEWGWAMTLEEARMLIDGKLVPASGSRTYENVNPATEQVIGVTADATVDDIKGAIDAARRAFDESSWATDAELRATSIKQLGAALDEERALLRDVLVAEAGCPIMLTDVIQLDQPLRDFVHWADVATSYEYETSLPETEFWGGRHRRQVWREPVGVVAAITVWNYPLFLHLAKLGPALAAGCTVVLKPPPDTPWTATHIGRLIAERTDIPPGVVNIVTAADPAAGEVLTTDPRVDMVTFTGSAATGRRIMAAAAPTLKKIALELGGKSAMIALDDSKVDEVALGTGMGMCTHAGQGCAMTTRLLVPRARYAEAVDAAVAGMASVKVGDPTDPEVLQGPQISARQRERVLGYIEKGRAEGGRIACGGGRPADLPVGFYVAPTVIADADESSTVAQEEIFGPVLVVLPFEDDADAVRIANNTIYGLSGAVSSASLERATAVARKLRSGTVGVNGGQWFGVDSPFGGYKHSGIGRENGLQGFEEFLETKTVGLPA